MANMNEPWKLGRVRQCEKCPWKVSTDPRKIPNGYSETLHRSLIATIATPEDRLGNNHAMACHEHPGGEEAHCVGWLVHQLGPGNNIGLRLRIRSCENAHLLVVDGEQHIRFEDTFPSVKSPAWTEE